jgi:hypothetical protein
VAEVLVTSFFCHFGIPRVLHNEQGCNFEPHLMQEVLQPLGVCKTHTMPLHLKTDGMVEEHLQKVIT